MLGDIPSSSGHVNRAELAALSSVRLGLCALGRGRMVNFIPDATNEPVRRLPHSTPKETLSLLPEWDGSML